MTGRQEGQAHTADGRHEFRPMWRSGSGKCVAKLPHTVYRCGRPADDPIHGAAPSAERSEGQPATHCCDAAEKLRDIFGVGRWEVWRDAEAWQTRRLPDEPSAGERPVPAVVTFTESPPEVLAAGYTLGAGERPVVVEPAGHVCCLMHPDRYTEDEIRAAADTAAWGFPAVRRQRFAEDLIAALRQRRETT